MIGPLPPALGIRLIYSGYFIPEVGIGRMNKFQRYATFLDKRIFYLMKTVLTKTSENSKQ
jgi:hypothetical protein